jgi:predicted Zn-dependent protease
MDGIFYDENPEQGLFVENLFVHPDLGFVIRFPGEWDYFNYPIAAGATQPNGEAQIMLSGIPEKAEPDSIGAAFAKYLKDEFKLSLDKEEPMVVNDNPAYYILFVDNSGEQPVHYQFCWIKNRDDLYQIAGYSFPHYKEELFQVINSFRLASPEEVNPEIKRIRVATVREGEDYVAFNKRTGNLWDVATTNAINGRDENTVLQEGQTLKILDSEIYQPSR